MTTLSPPIHPESPSHPFHLPCPQLSNSSGSIPEEKAFGLPPHNEVVTDSAAEHSYDEDDAHILSPLLDEATGPERSIQVTKNNGSRPSSGQKKKTKLTFGEGPLATPPGSAAPLEMRQMMIGNKSKAIAIGNGRRGSASNYSNSPSATLLRGRSNGSDEDTGTRRRLRKLTIGSSSESSSASSNGSDNEGPGDAFDANIKFS